MSNQFLKLRRSSVQGKIPTTSSIDFGEIALNTYDGLAFIKKSGSLGEQVVTLGSTNGSFTGSFSGSFTGSLEGTASFATRSTITYVTSSNEVLSEIEVADFDNNVAVTYVNGRLKFIFGAPTVPSVPVASFNSTFATDRFNAVSDNYTVTGTITVNGYTLVSASLFEGATLLANTGSGATSLIFNTTTTGSHTYSFQVTASSPLDGTLNQQAVTLAKMQDLQLLQKTNLIYRLVPDLSH